MTPRSSVIDAVQLLKGSGEVLIRARVPALAAWVPAAMPDRVKLMSPSLSGLPEPESRLQAEEPAKAGTPNLGVSVQHVCLLLFRL